MRKSRDITVTLSRVWDTVLVHMHRYDALRPPPLREAKPKYSEALVSACPSTCFCKCLCENWNSVVGEIWFFLETVLRSPPLGRTPSLCIFIALLSHCDRVSHKMVLQDPLHWNAMSPRSDAVLSTPSPRGATTRHDTDEVTMIPTT